MNDIEFGLRIPSFPVDGSTVPDFITQIVSFIQQACHCFDSAWICDHFFPWLKMQSKTIGNLECFTTISYLSGIFPRIDFGSLVLCNSYRNPALLAKMAATLQVLTGGRFILGLGAGWNKSEYIAYGYEYPSAKVRIKQLAEGLHIIRKMWTEEKPTFIGEYFKIEGAYCSPKPKPPPQIMVGGGGEKQTLKVVARYADWWNPPNVNLEVYQRKLEINANSKSSKISAIRKAETSET
jgi:alkanesulfonate monooxygenase SsuD/methylene tetrahydromethanopterin reductase-like flavin-dependent oxidoreductase (luciferase family)